jgi:hypothetical protein
MLARFARRRFADPLVAGVKNRAALGASEVEVKMHGPIGWVVEPLRGAN